MLGRGTGRGAKGNELDQEATLQKSLPKPRGPVMGPPHTQAEEDPSSVKGGGLPFLTEPHEALTVSARTELAAGRWKSVIRPLPKDV